MSISTLPTELIALTLQHLTRLNKLTPWGIGETVRLRLVSKDFNDEIERILFVDAYLDVETWRQTDCLQCKRIVRAERPNKALNKLTCLRYLVALFGLRELPKWDMRIKQFAVMKQAIAELEQIPGFVEKITRTDTRLSKEALTVLNFVTSRGTEAERKLLVGRALADALVTLLGVRNVWSNFGPHHDSCGSQVWSRARTVNFWKIVIASHLGDLQIVKDCLRTLPFDSLEKGLRNVKLNTEANESYVQYIADYLSAALTVAIRQGHQDIIDCLFEQTGADTELVLITKKYFNKGSVLGAAVNATNHQDKAVVRIAVNIVDKILNLWETFGRDKIDAAHNERLLMGISSAAPNLFKKAVRKLSSNTVNEVSKYLLLETALSGDVDKMKCLLQNLGKDTNQPAGPRIMESWSDEYGVGLDRLLKRSNIFTVAAAKGHIEILLVLKDHLAQVEQALFQTGQLKRDENRTMRDWRIMAGQNHRITLGVHPIRDAVNDVFIKNDRLPGKKFRPIPPAEALRVLLEFAPEGMSWGAETVACAGLSQPEYLVELLKVVKLDEWFPDKLSDDRTRTPVGLSLEGAKNVTIGERALQHALRLVKADNVKLLLEHGATLAEGTKIATPIFAIDEKQMAERDQVRDVLETYAKAKGGSQKIAWITQALSIDYYAPVEEAMSAEQMWAIEKDDKHFRWQVGNKSRGRNRPTNFVTEDAFAQTSN